MEEEEEWIDFGLMRTRDSIYGVLCKFSTLRVIYYRTWDRKRAFFLCF